MLKGLPMRKSNAAYYPMMLGSLLASEKLQAVLAVSRPVNSSGVTAAPRAGMVMSQAIKQSNFNSAMSAESTCACAHAKAFGVLMCVQLSHGIQGL